MYTTEAIETTQRALDEIIETHKRLAGEIEAATNKGNAAPKKVAKEFESLDKEIDAVVSVKELLNTISGEEDIPRVANEMKVRFKVEEARTNPWPNLAYLTVFRIFFYELGNEDHHIPLA